MIPSLVVNDEMYMKFTAKITYHLLVRNVYMPKKIFFWAGEVSPGCQHEP